MTLVNARAAFETAILNAVQDSDPTVTVVFDNTPFSTPGKNKKYVILDIPLLLEKNINNKKDILVFVQSKKQDIEKRLKKRTGFNSKLLKKFKNIQLNLAYKKRKSHYILKNKFTEKSVKKEIKKILSQI